MIIIINIYALYRVLYKSITVEEFYDILQEEAANDAVIKLLEQKKNEINNK